MNKFNYSLIITLLLVFIGLNSFGQKKEQRKDTTDSKVGGVQQYVIIDPGGDPDPPDNPPNPTASTNTCGNKTLSYNGTPPGTVSWYWQSSSSGTSKSAGSSTHTATSSGTYYLRAFDHTTNLWSNGSGHVTVTVNPLPSAPSAPSVQNNCASSTLTRGTPPSGITWYWQGTNSSGTSTSNSSSIYTVAGATTIYLRARRNSTGCWGGSVGVSTNPKSLPSTPPVPIVSSNTCGAVELSWDGAPPQPWYWQTSANGTSTANHTLTYTANQSGTYYLRAKNSNGCWSGAASVTVTVNSIPSTPSIPSEEIGCGGSTLTRGTPPGGITWYWQGTNSSGSSTSNASLTYFAAATATYYIRARNNITGCWSGSRSITITDHAPSAPSAPSVQDNCGSSALTRGTPPGGITWYWQGQSSNGTSTSNSSVTYNAPLSGTFYLRARNNSTGCWGGSVGVSTDPDPLPPTPNDPIADDNLCGDIELRWGDDPPQSWYWQTSPTGTSTANSGLFYTATESGTYYLRAKNNHGCWSGAASVDVIVDPGPDIPDIPTVTNHYGWTRMSADLFNAQEGVSLYWQTESTGTSTAEEGSVDVDVSGTYYLRGQADVGGCWGPGQAVNVSITPSPVIIVSSTQLAFNTNIPLSLEYSNYDEITWMKDGETVGSGPTFIATESGDYTVIVSKNGVLGASISTSVTITDPLDDQNMNYVKVNSIFKEGVLTQSDAHALTIDDRSQAVSYVGGLGQTLQTIATKASPGKQDIIQPYAYDQYGRQLQSYLGYTAATDDATYHIHALDNNGYTSSEQYNFYQQTGEDRATDTAPYGTVSVEPSPLQRTMSTLAPGESWHNNQKTVAYQYNLNTQGDNIQQWKLDANGLPYTDDTYTEGQLWKNTVTDEEGKTSIGFTDKFGRGIVQKAKVDASTWASTYRVYDRMGRLRYILPPAFMAIQHTSPSQAELDKWAFQYHYNSRGQVIESKTPGADWDYAIYDDRDRIVMTQNAQQRSRHEWTFVKYDQLNRPVLTGLYTNTSATTRAAVQQLADSFYSGGGDRYEVRGGSIHGYTNQSFPQVSHVDDYLAVNFYDNYDFKSDSEWQGGDYDFDNPDSLEAFDYVRSLSTGSMVKTSDGQWLKSVVYYDKNYQPIQAKADNHLGGIDEVTAYYDFAGQVLKTIHYHTDGTNAMQTTVRYEYDHAGRLLKTWHRINDNGEVLLSELKYNALGQLVEKNIHKGVSGKFLQSVDLQYNIRGWLTSINDTQLDADPADDEEDLFGMNISYEDGAAPQYNGNIGEVQWNKSGDENPGKYAYTYDGMNRLTDAHTGTNPGPDYDMDAQYDLNGNITQLARNNSSLLMDSLLYTYEGNRLTKVSDASTDEGFKDGNTSGDDFAYDTSGSLVQDKNKGIDSIAYNFQNLPVEILFDDGARITNIYSASGAKLKQTLYDTDGSTVLKTTDYTPGYVYENGNMQYMFTGEGRALRDPADNHWEYQYQLTDHLGNVRVMFTSDPDAVSFKATMESDTTEQADDALFMNIEDHPVDTQATSYDQVQRLLSGNIDGAGISLPVYPGDTVEMKVQGFYRNGDGSTTASLNALITAAAGIFGGIDGGSTSEQAIYDAFETTYDPTLGGVGVQQPPSGYVAAYLNYIMFDKNFNAVQEGFVPLDDDANGAAIEISIPGQVVEQEGFVYVYLTNESNAEVYYDDFEVTVKESRVVQANDYYPFGLQQSTSWTRSNALANKYLYNAGSELNERTGYYETLLRNYDPTIGRFTGVDALAALTPGMNPYQFGGNNPVMYNDPTGAYMQGWQDVTRFLSSAPGANPFDKPFENSNWVDEFNMGFTPSFGSVVGNLMGSQYGGSWSSSGGYNYFSSNTEAFNAGLAYNEYHNSWSNTTYGAPSGGQRRLGQRTDNGDFFQIDGAGKLYVPYTDVSYWDYKQIQQAGGYNSTDQAGMTDFSNSNMALAVGGAAYGAMERGTVSQGYWLGKNGKYYSLKWGGNQYTGSRASALSDAKLFRNAGRATVVVSVAIGIYSTREGYIADGGEFGYNAQMAAASSTGSIVGGWAGAEAGALIGAGIGVWFGGVGAVPGAVIGGFIGGIAGSFGGSYAGESAVNYYHGR